MKTKKYLLMILAIGCLIINVFAGEGISPRGTLNSYPQGIVANFTMSSTQINVGQMLTFTNTSTGNPFPNQWQWNFGDGSLLSPLISPNKIYSTPGTYNVTLRAFNGNSYSYCTQTVNVGSNDHGIQVQIVEKGSSGLVQYVGYEFKYKEKILGQDKIKKEMLYFPVVSQNANINIFKVAQTFDTELKKLINDFEGKIYLFDSQKIRRGYINFEYNYEKQKEFTRNAIIILHNNSEMTSDNYFPYGPNKVDYDKKWKYYETGDFPVSMLIPPNNTFTTVYDKTPLLLVHGWEGSYKYNNNPDANTNLDEVSYWYTTAWKLNQGNYFHTWQFYYPYNTDHKHLAICLKDAIDILREKYTGDQKKIRVVTHSMGGAVTMHYLSDYNQNAYNNIQKILFLAPPAHGSLGANLYYKTVGSPLLNLRIGYDQNAPAVRDLKLGSDANIHTNSLMDSWPDLDNSGYKYDDYFVLTGSTYRRYMSDIGSCLHEEAIDHHDGIVAISSASLLDHGIGLGVFDGNHDDARNGQSKKPGNQNIGDPMFIPNIITDYFTKTYNNFITYLYQPQYQHITTIINHNKTVVKPANTPSIGQIDTQNGVNYKKGILNLEFNNTPNTDIYSCWYNRNQKKLYLLPFSYAHTVQMSLPTWWLQLVGNPIIQQTFTGSFLKNENSSGQRRFYFNKDDIIDKGVGQLLYTGCAIDLEEGVNTVKIFNKFFGTVASETIDFNFCQTSNLSLDNTKTPASSLYADFTDLKFHNIAQSGMVIPDSSMAAFYIDNQASEIKFVLSGFSAEQYGIPLEIKLKLPDGTIVDSAYSGGAYSHNADFGEYTMTITDPQQGRWHVWAQSNVSGADTLQYQAMAYLQSLVHAYDAKTAEVAATGSNYILSIGLQLPNLLLSDSLSVKATVFKPGGTSVIINNMNNPSTTDSSYVFQNVISIDETGEYLIKYNYDGVYNGYRFERILYQSFSAVDTIPFLNIDKVKLYQNSPSLTLDLPSYTFNTGDYYDSLFFSLTKIGGNLDSTKIYYALDSTLRNLNLSSTLIDTGYVELVVSMHLNDQIVNDTIPVYVEMPDLAIYNAQASQSTIYQGDNLLISYLYNNQGNHDALQHNIKVFISENSTLDSADLCFSQREIQFLAYDSVFSLTDTLIVPSSLGFQNGYLIVVADADNFVIEPNEGNNSAVLPLTIQCQTTVSLKVFLEGPFNGSFMQTRLNSLDLLPSTQPYNQSPWAYDGDEYRSEMIPEVVDWIYIELRDAYEATLAANSTIKSRQAAFVLNNGQIVDVTGSPYMNFDTQIEQNLFVVIYHRNHLAIMSAVPLQLVNGVYNYDFTTGFDKVYGGVSGYKQLATSVWGMVGGDGDSNGHIQLQDYSISWDFQAGNSGYLNCDFDLNGEVQNQDKNQIWLYNIAKQSMVP